MPPTMTPSNRQLGMNDRPEDSPAQKTEKNELDDAAAGHMLGIWTAHPAEVHAGPNQDADHPDNPKEQTS